MTSNIKNLLQEFCQSRRENIPQYITIDVGDKPHKPQWVSTVKIESRGEFVSSAKQSKREAEKDAAQLAYTAITSIDDGAITWMPSSQVTNIYIDVENQSRSAINLMKLLTKSIDQLPKNVNIHFVMSTECALIDRLKADQLSLGRNNILCIITPCSAVTRIIINTSRDIIHSDVIILSSDKFIHQLKTTLEDMDTQHVIKTPSSFDEFCALIFS